MKKGEQPAVISLNIPGAPCIVANPNAPKADGEEKPPGDDKSDDDEPKEEGVASDAWNKSSFTVRIMPVHIAVCKRFVADLIGCTVAEGGGHSN